MGNISNSGKAARDEREKKIKLKHRFENRITIAKFGKTALDAGDYATALRNFTDYLSIMAEIKEVREFYELKIHMFDSKRDLTETFMISQILFEMARLYDAVPKFQPAAEKCLGLFVHFTANQPYQVVNSEMVRKSLKRSAFKSPDMFRNAYQQIYVQSKKCYIVTFCYGDQHPITSTCREFKDWLLSYGFGQSLVRQYYLISSKAIPVCEQNTLLRVTTRFMARPALYLFSKTILPMIIKKC
ncbi:MAG: hypothetical protein H0V66_04855 [Bdellovibrionales bacterium]|nr:hypothetical protein [Bdellovibrionales bacterium]